jgi:hypothetical protein
MEIQITSQDKNYFKQRIENMQKTGEKNFFRSFQQMTKVSDGVLLLLKKYKDNVANLYWEDLRPGIDSMRSQHLSDIVDLSPTDPVFRGEPYNNPDNTPH